MPLFKIENQRFTKLPPTDFHNERELQNLVDGNLEDIMGVRWIASWFNIPNGQIDALGIDEQNTPVIIEYKWKQDSGAIIQGLFYLNWVSQNKKTFELLVSEKFGERISVKWDSPRLIIIAKDFTDKDIAAINQIKPVVELKKYSYYGDLINIEDLTPAKLSRVGRVAEPVKEEGVGVEGEQYTIDKLLQKASPELKEVFLTLRTRILELGDDVWEKVGEGYCDYRKTSTFATPFIRTTKNRLLVYIKMGDKEIEDPEHWTIKKDFTYGKLNTRFELKLLDQVDYAMHLIKQAYEFVP